MADDQELVRLGGAVDRGDLRAARRALQAALDGDRQRRDRVLDLLAGRAAAGSPIAVELLVEQVDVQGLARAGVRQWLVDESAVDDVAQDTLIAMAQSLPRYTGEASLVTWLFTIARNKAADHLRRRRATGPLADDEVGEAVRISSMISKQETVREAVQQLPDHHRQAVQLRDIDQLPYADVAEHLGININTAKSHVARGRAQLAAILEAPAA